ncbi:MAG: RNB domain-containing ribonuclease, partial [Rhodoferax sp.]
HLPLVLPVMGAQGLPRGARVRVKLGDIDLVSLDLHGTVLERLDAEPEVFDAEEEQDEDSVVGPITIAVDLDEAEAKPPADAPEAPDRP